MRHVPPEIRKRDDAMSTAHTYARFHNRKAALPKVKFFVQRAMKAAPLSKRQIDNLIVSLGREDAMKIIGGEL